MRLCLTEAHARTIAQHARDEYPHEICGVLGGVGDHVQHVIPTTNIATNPAHHYRIDDRALVDALRDLDQRGLSLIGFYHSHPNGDPIPSQTDIQEAAYPHTPYLIVGLRSVEARFAAWLLSYGEVTPVELVIGIPHAPEESFSAAQKNAVVISALMAFVLMLILAVTLLPPAPPIP